MPLIGAEAVAASALAFLASSIIAAYLADWLGFRIVPFAILPLSAIAAAATFLCLRRRSTHDAPALAAFAAIVCLMFAWLLWLARPDLLPTGSGPDLAHHLALIEYIERHHRLVHDVRLSEYLGEMIDYTPGVHLLAVLTGAWFRSDALHALYPVVAWSVALKAGFVLLIALRLLGAVDGDVPRIPFALTAVVLLFLPRMYFIGSFTEQSFVAQVLSELFAVAMWWAVLVWDARPARIEVMFYALSGTAAFLTWPVSAGPLLVLLAAVMLLQRRISRRARLQHLAIATVPIAAIIAVHGTSHAGGFRMAGTGGFAIWPTVGVLGRWFIALSAAGFLCCAAERRARTVTLLLAAIALQAAALVATAHASGAGAPYLALKMFYLAIYPLAIAITLTLAAGWRAAVRTVGRSGMRSAALAWLLVAFLGIAVARPLIAAPRPRPVVTQPALVAAEWARANMPPACIDYLVIDGYTAYWLHLAVFGHPRASGRALNDDTFEPKKGLDRWILPNGLPFAVADDFDALPRDIRTNVDVVARFGPAAVVKRRGPSTCPQP
jgi:hypothetical protein